MSRKRRRSANKAKTRRANQTTMAEFRSQLQAAGSDLLDASETHPSPTPRGSAPDGSPHREPDAAPAERQNSANPEMVVTAIRELVATSSVEVDELPEDPVVEPIPVAQPDKTYCDDRWAELRVPREDIEIYSADPEAADATAPDMQPDDEAGMEHPADELNGTASTPMPTQPEAQDATHDAQNLDQPTAPEGIVPEIVPPQMRQRWDQPDNHTMSKSGRVLWNAGIFGVLLIVPISLFGTSPFPATETAKHYVALGGCQFGDMFRLNPAPEGAPGYHGVLDEDGDGLACEPEQSEPSVTVGAGGARFIRP